MRFKAQDTTAKRLQKRIAVACGKVPADIVIKNAQILDVFAGDFFTGDVAVADGIIVGTQESYEGAETLDGSDCFVVPGFIDSHVHIESSLMTPVRFQESVLPHGTTTVLWDPHEIANVLGTAGVKWALSASEKLMLDVFVLLPSCVPATHLETSGARLDPDDLKTFKGQNRVLGLAEVMNYPGVLNSEESMGQKLELFADGIRDGHAPQLRGRALNCYLCAGIQSCHESSDIEEAREKLRKGMHVLVREGSCAKNANDLLPLITTYSSATVALCSDDRNPADIRTEGHIDFIINLALAQGIPPENIFRSASFAAAKAYGFLDRGVVAPGYVGDLVVVKQVKKGSWKEGFAVHKVIKNGQFVEADALRRDADKRQGHDRPAMQKKNINMQPLSMEMLTVKHPASAQGTRISCRIIEVLPDQIITGCQIKQLPIKAGEVLPDHDQDILKIAVFERHHATGNHAVAFAQGFGLKSGALAASIGHDSHNIVVIGASDACIFAAIEAVRAMDGGIVVIDGNGKTAASLSLPIGGLMTDAPIESVANSIVTLKQEAKKIGCVLHEPFLQMSFLALPVIPTLKITDKGLVDVDTFQIVSLFT